MEQYAMQLQENIPKEIFFIFLFFLALGLQDLPLKCNSSLPSSGARNLRCPEEEVAIGRKG